MSRYVPLTPEEAMIKKWIEHLLTDGDSISAAALETFGEKAIPAVLEALKDWRAKPSQRNPNPRALVGLCRVLRPYAPPHAVNLLAPLLPKARGEARGALVRLLLRIGAGPAIEAIRSALEDPDPKQRAEAEGALWGEVGRFRLRPDPSPTERLIDVLGPRLAHRKDETTFGYLAETLLGLNPTRGTSILVRGGYLGAEHPWLLAALTAFDRTRVAPPAEVLRPLVPVLREHDERTRGLSGAPRLYGALLKVFARAAPADAGPLVDEALSSDEPTWKPGAIDALAILAGVEDALHAAFRAAYERDENGAVRYLGQQLTPPQRNYVVAYHVDEEVCNGGFRQFFFNPSGTHARSAPDALDAIGAPKKADLMRRALDIFAPEPGAAGERLYVHFLHEPQTRQLLRELDDAYYASGDESVLDLLTLYAVRNREHFQ